MSKKLCSNLIRGVQPLCLAVCILLAGSTLMAQSTGSIDGTVVDSTEAVTPNATIVLTNMDTGQSREITNSQEGYFIFPDLLPGRYSIRITATGFKALVQGPLILTVGQRMTVRPVLQVGALSESVEVTGTPPPVTTASSSVSQLVDTQRIEELPLNGRNALQLVSLVPGVVSTGTAGQFGATQVTFSGSGGRAIDMNFSLDGGFNMNSFFSIANEYPNPDALQEFAVTTRNYSAAFGRGTTSVSAVTKSGTNEFHGTAFEFLRNTDLDSRPFFAARRSVFKRNQYGGTFGGPVIKNKLFFFFGYQGTAVRGSPGDQTYATMTAPQREGNFSGTAAAILDPTTKTQFPNNIIPTSRIRPYASNFIKNFLPAANSGDFYRFVVGNQLDQKQVTARVDYSLSDKDKVSVRYFFNDVPQRSMANGSGSAIDADWISDMPTRFQNTTLMYTRMFSATLINDLRVSYIRSAFGLLPLKQFSLTGVGFPVSVGSSYGDFGLTPESALSVSGLFTADMGAPTRDVMPTTHVADTLSWMHGMHKIDFGFELYRNRINELQNWNTGGTIAFNGTVTGNSAADFLLGQFSSFRQISGLSARLRQTLPALFVQDDMHLARRFTLSLGLRWEPARGYVSQDQQLMSFQPGKQSTLFPKASPGLLFPGDAGLPDSIIGSRWNNLAPRAGIAWDVRGDGKTSIRSGFGIYYTPLTRGISLNRFTLIQPFTLDVSVYGGNADNIFAAAPFNGVNPFPRPMAGNLAGLQAIDFVPTANETAFARPFKTQTDYQWSFSIQQAIGHDAIIEADYVGSSSSHLFTSVEGNPAVYTPGSSTTSNTQARRIYNWVGNLNVGMTGIGANYNSFQFSVNKRYSHGFSVLSSYTWSKALGVVGSTGEGSNGPRDPWNYGLDYGPQSFDIRHNFVTSFIWNVPAGHIASPILRGVVQGWQLTGIAIVRSGTPLTLRSGRDNSLTGIGNDTPDVAGDWNISGDRSKAQQIQSWFNPAAFVQNAIGTYGQVGIGALRNPGFWNWDFAGSKEFRIAERKRLEFRSSFYNAFNHANLNGPTGSLTSSAFGKISSTSDPRVIEFGLKFAF